MRLWTLHPKYLDAKGLVAAWREALLAQAVLRDRTTGYRRHPQLIRFRRSRSPVRSIGSYLHALHVEARRRGYRFDRGKIAYPGGRSRLKATLGQLGYEWKHLRAKLAIRDKAWLASLGRVARPDAHPTFRVVTGDVEDWEVGGRRRRRHSCTIGGIQAVWCGVQRGQPVARYRLGLSVAALRYTCGKALRSAAYSGGAPRRQPGGPRKRATSDPAMTSSMAARPSCPRRDQPNLCGHLDPRLGNELLLSDVHDDRSWRWPPAAIRQSAETRACTTWAMLPGTETGSGSVAEVTGAWQARRSEISAPGSTSSKPKASSRSCWLDTAPAGLRCAATSLKRRIHGWWEWFSLPAQFAPRQGRRTPINSRKPSA